MEPDVKLAGPTIGMAVHSEHVEPRDVDRRVRELEGAGWKVTGGHPCSNVSVAKGRLRPDGRYEEYFEVVPHAVRITAEKPDG